MRKYAIAVLAVAVIGVGFAAAQITAPFKDAPFLLIPTADSVGCPNDQVVKILIKSGNLDISCEDAH